MTEAHIQEILMQARDDTPIIKALSALTTLEYDRIRKSEAETLGVSVGALDKAVKEARALTKQPPFMETDHSLFEEIELWPDAVACSELLDEISAIFRRFAILPLHADTALALWVVFTWCVDSMNVAPILAIESPEKRCGKTTVLSLVSKLTKRPLSTANITPAALFRTIEKYHATILIDEADTFLRTSDELRGIINSGHTRSTAFVIRTVGEDHEPKRFCTWSAKAIALIGHLPDTLHDRSVVIELKRKTTGQETENLRHADQSLFSTLQQKLARFAQDNLETLKTARPILPSNISDRAQDNWEPLIAIAELAGNVWQERALKAAQFLSVANEPLSIGVELLSDIYDILDQRAEDKISSADLIEALCKDSERPWLTYNKGRQISPRQVSSRLKEYGIESKNIRMGSVVKGYESKQFYDAFTRYLPTAPHESTTTLQSTECLEFDVADYRPFTNTHTISATPKPSQLADCSVVADISRRVEKVEVFEL